MRAHLYTAVYRYIRPLPPPPPPAYRGATEGPIRRGGGGGLAGTPSSSGPPMVPTEGGPKILKLLLAPKAPKQNFGCQPQTLEGEGGGVFMVLETAQEARDMVTHSIGRCAGGRDIAV